MCVLGGVGGGQMLLYMILRMTVWRTTHKQTAAITVNINTTHTAVSHTHTRRLTQTHIGLVDCGAFCITFKIHFITDLGVFQVCGLVTNMVKLTQNKW